MKRLVPLLILALASCRSPGGGDSDSDAASGTGPETDGGAGAPDAAEGGAGGRAAADDAVLPAGFSMEGTPRVVERRLPPGAAWRWLRSMARNELLEAHRQGEDRLLTLEAGAVSVTERSGARTVWPLPEGLRLEGTPVHVVLGKELTVALWRSDGTQVAAAPETTVVRAAFGDGRESSLVVKEGRAFETISHSG